MKLDWTLIKAAHRATEQDKMGEFTIVDNAHFMRINLLYNSKRQCNDHYKRWLEYTPGMRLEFISLRRSNLAVARYMGTYELECSTYRELVKSIYRGINNNLNLKLRSQKYLYELAKEENATLNLDI